MAHPFIPKYLHTGERAMYTSTTRLDHIVDLDWEDSNVLVDDLLAHATQSKFLYDHKWTFGDMLTWDNLCTI